MNVFIATDLEGISGVCSLSHIFDPKDEGYRAARHSLAVDTNTAVRAAYDAGAEHVYVNDGHAGGGNIDPTELDPRATLVKIADVPPIMSSLDAVVFIGSHAMSGTQRAFLDHTQSSSTIHRYLYNGKEIGEMTQAGTYFGHFGVPCVAISGDRAACEEAKTVFGKSIETAEVKYANERNVAVCLDEDEAQRAIYQAVKKGLENRAAVPPLSVTLPLQITVEFQLTSHCDAACQAPSVERLDGFSARSVKTKIETFWDVLL